MKLPCSWLRELSGVDWSNQEIAARLTASGTSGEAKAVNPDHFTNVVVGQIVNLEKHPNADRLQIAEVDTGKETYSVICGAPNCAKGQKVILALPGANLKGEFKVKPVTMRGVKSAGMICAEDELGLSDDHAGIIVLDDNAPLGMPAYEYLDLDDVVIDFEITPNRPDCLCAFGIARELSVQAEKQFKPELKPPVETDEKASDYISVKIEDADACPRYAARIIKNIKIGPSPEWLKKKLVGCGLRPINNIVDITNFVMLETCQPLHAFDYDEFGSKEVVIRRARDGEQFVTLDNQNHKLDQSVLMITNGNRGVAAAGVMGGLDSEVSDKTTTILLESAYFDPSVIRKSGRKLGISSESSYRFERGVDPNGIVRAANRAAALMAELAGGEVLSGVVDNYAKKIDPTTIELRPARIKRLLGIEPGTEFIKNSLERLGMDVEMGEVIKAKAPTYRPDLVREVDLIEEIARLYGLDKLPVTKHNAGPLFAPTHRRDTIKTDLRNIMTGFGFEETITSGFAHPQRMNKVDDTTEPIKVLNPISEEFGVMRSRILYSLLLSAGNNVRHRNMDIKIFEIGRVYTRLNSNLAEPEYLGFLISGRPDGDYWKNHPAASDIYEVKGVVEALANCLDLGRLAPLKPVVKPGYDKSQAFEVSQDGNLIGHIGRIDSDVARQFDIKQDCFAAELDISRLIELKKNLEKYKPLPKYPASSRDISIVVENEVAAGMLQDEIAKVGGRLIESVNVFDLFTGKPVQDGHKSLAFSVNYRSTEKTLEDEEVDTVHNKIIAHLESNFRAKLRE